MEDLRRPLRPFGTQRTSLVETRFHILATSQASVAAVTLPGTFSIAFAASLTALTPRGPIGPSWTSRGAATGGVVFEFFARSTSLWKRTRTGTRSGTVTAGDGTIRPWTPVTPVRTRHHVANVGAIVQSRAPTVNGALSSTVSGATAAKHRTFGPFRPAGPRVARSFIAVLGTLSIAHARGAALTRSFPGGLTFPASDAARAPRTPVGPSGARRHVSTRLGLGFGFGLVGVTIDGASTISRLLTTGTARN